MKYERLVVELRRVFLEANCYYRDYLDTPRSKYLRHKRKNDKVLDEVLTWLWKLEDLNK